jgi:2-aminoadipate transaminase
MSFVVEPQAEMRPGIIELRWGDPDPALLPMEIIAAATNRVFTDVGPAALNYGTNEGPLLLRTGGGGGRARAARIAPRARRPLDLTEIAATNGNSPALHQLTTLLVRPGDVVFVEDPGFSLALRMFRDLGVELMGVSFDQDGLDVDALEEAVASVRARGVRPRMLYTVATFHNPTGVSLAPERRRRLLEIAVESDLLVVEDDVYRELVYHHEAPRSLWSLAPEVEGSSEFVVRLGSFSKTLSPGLRSGFLTGPAPVVERFTQSGLLDSAGCLSQFTSCIVAETVASGDYDANVARLREAYGARRDALVEGLRRALPASCAFTEPDGGFFLWVTLPEGIKASDLVPVAERHGVSFFSGARFSVRGDDRGLRLGFSMYEPVDLVAGAERLADSIAEVLASHRASGGAWAYSAEADRPGA